MKRVFAAIDISNGARRALVEYVSGLQGEFPNLAVRWERPEKLHITVKFAGSLDEAQLAIFLERVKAASRATGPFRLKIAGTGAFIKRRGPSVLWLGIHQVSGDPLGTLSRMLAGESDKRSFHPHITIARIRDVKKANELIEKHETALFDPVGFDVEELVIYESTLLPAGSVYTQIASFLLNTM
jgi:2'-5' RNA ligase